MEGLIMVAMPLNRLDMDAFTVLVVEQEPGLRSAIRLELQLAGFLAADAWNGYEALTILREEPPDVLVLDLAIPGVGSVAILGEMRTLGLLGRTRVLLLSDREDVAAAADLLALGVDGVMQKPATPRDVCHRVEVLLQHRPRENRQNRLEALLMRADRLLTPF